MGDSTAGGTATGTLNLTGGIVTLAGDITRAGGTGTMSATVNLSGGTLDMGGNDIGSGANAVTLKPNPARCRMSRPSTAPAASPRPRRARRFSPAPTPTAARPARRISMLAPCLQPTRARCQATIPPAGSPSPMARPWRFAPVARVSGTSARKSTACSDPPPAAFVSGSKLGIDVATGNTFSYGNDIGATQAAKGLVKSAQARSRSPAQTPTPAPPTVNAGTLNVTGSTATNSA